MNLLEAILLGIIQGATEFLPVSSSGHLLVIPALLQTTIPDENIISLAHVGTLIAVFTYFWRDIYNIILALLEDVRQRKFGTSMASRSGWFIGLGSIPASIAYVLWGEEFDRIFGNPNYAALFLILTAAILVTGERLKSGSKDMSQLTWKDALIIGAAQMVALLPGVSRSGSTIGVGLARDFDREQAARFSFLLGIPAIMGAGAKSMIDVMQAPALFMQLPAILLMVSVSAIVGYLCIRLLLNWLKQRNLYIFAAYCIVLSLLYFVVFFIRT